MNYKKIACVGAGFSGAVIARELANKGFLVDVFDKRKHVAGNCHTSVDEKTQILVHNYGPHIFHTSDKKIWDYINQFGGFTPYTNRVKALTEKGMFSLPINLLTINQLFNEKLNPSEAKKFIEEKSQKNIREIKSFEDQALSMLGEKIYKTFFYGYTKKQWGKDPRDLPASILKRLPVRFNYDDNYYNSHYQGVPTKGYTKIIEKMLQHENISVFLNRVFEPKNIENYDWTFNSGKLDEWYDYIYGPLEYRTLDFEKFYHAGDFQGNPVINYCEEEVSWTRITEYQHFMPQVKRESNLSICHKEYSRSCQKADIPYYPVRLTNDKQKLEKYASRAKSEKTPFTFIGRLGTYRYLDMDKVISESLSLAKNFLESPSSFDKKFTLNPC